jgi:hypothetical protein
VAVVQFQDVVEVHEEQAADNLPITFRQMAKKKLKLLPASSALCMTLFEPVIYLGDRAASTILDLAADGFGFLSNQAGADAPLRLETTQPSAFWHCFSF